MGGTQQFPPIREPADGTTIPTPIRLQEMSVPHVPEKYGFTLLYIPGLHKCDLSSQRTIFSPQADPVRPGSEQY